MINCNIIYFAVCAGNVQNVKPVQNCACHPHKLYISKNSSLRLHYMARYSWFFLFDFLRFRCGCFFFCCCCCFVFVLFCFLSESRWSLSALSACAIWTSLCREQMMKVFLETIQNIQVVYHTRGSRGGPGSGHTPYPIPLKFC